jgi:hypothetical protein
MNVMMTPTWRIKLHLIPSKEEPLRVQCEIVEVASVEDGAGYQCGYDASGPVTFVSVEAFSTRYSSGCRAILPAQKALDNEIPLPPRSVAPKNCKTDGTGGKRLL